MNGFDPALLRQLVQELASALQRFQSDRNAR